MQLTPDHQAESWSRIDGLLRRDFEEPDLDAAKIMFSCVAAHRIVDYPPVWVMAVAPSGSLKTVIIESLQSLPSTHFKDEVTPQTFISGKLDDKPGRKKRQTPASLLHRIGAEGILLTADFSTILAMDEKSRAKILAQLRRIYDGYFSRDFGTDENLEEREWKGRLTFITGVTPEIDSQYSVFRSLGERFVQVRWPRAGGVETGLKAMQQRTTLPQELQVAVRQLLAPILSQQSCTAPVIDRPTMVRLANLGEFVALARAHVSRSRNDHEILAPPSPEGNTRLPQEFAQVARGSSLLAGRFEVTEEDFALVRRVAFDCIPQTRRTILSALLLEKNPYTIGLPNVVAERALEDLGCLGLVEKHPIHQVSCLTKTARNLMRGTESSPNAHSEESGSSAYTVQVGGK